MAAASSIGLIAGAVLFGLTLIVLGVRGVIRLWRDERAE